jgi:predicted PurR-regulated permease PerM
MTTPRELNRIAWVTLVVLASGAAYLCFLVLSPFIEPLAYGVIGATLAYPLHRWTLARLKHPSLAALLTSLIFVVVFVGPLTFVITVVVRELRSAYAALSPGAAGEGADRLWQAWSTLIDRVAAWLGTDSAELRQAITGRVGAAVSGVAERALALAGATAGGIIRLIVALMALFFGLRNGAGMYAAVLAHSPIGRARTERLCEAAHSMMVASSYGVIAVAAAQGLLCALGVWISGLPSPTLWGVAAAASSLIPLVGSGLVWIPAAALLLWQGSVGYGIFMLIWGAVVISQIDTVVRPWVLMAHMPMNSLVILVTLLGGAQAFGLIGIFLGPVILAVTMELLRILREDLNHAESSA